MFPLQVWFQNARAKYRRSNSNSKSEDDQQKGTDDNPESMTMEDAEKLLDLSNQRSPASSEVSSVADSVETQERLADHSSDSFTELFSDDMNVH